MDIGFFGENFVRGSVLSLKSISGGGQVSGIAKYLALQGSLRDYLGNFIK